jgi:sec-independent protein translocase protein TatC
MESTLTRNKNAVPFIQPESGPVEMSFMDHLEALRWHLVRAAIVLILAAIGVFIFVDWIFDHIIFAPARKEFISYTALCNLGHSLHIGDALCMPPVTIQLQGNTVSGPFMSAITIAFTCAIIISLPYILWELWRFIRPALNTKESKAVKGSIGWISLCFIVGAAFGYYLLAPFTFNFLGNYKLGSTGSYTYLPTLDDYIDTLTSLILGCGFGFELPVIAVVLSKIGILTPAMLKNYRKFAYLVILVLAAVITPSPDWTSQAIVTLPLLILYEISILLSKKVERKRKLA